MNDPKSAEKLIQNWLEFKLIDQGKAPATVEKYRCNLARFTLFVDDNELNLTTITRDQVREFAGMYLFKLGLSPRTRTTVVSALKGLFAWIQNEQIRDDNPTQNLEHPDYGKRLPKAMQLNDAKKLINQPNMTTFSGVRDVAMLSVLIGCGLRVSGCSSLNESSLIFGTDEKKGERLYIRVIEKRDKERIVPAPHETRLAIRAYLGHPEIDLIDRSIKDGDKVLFIATSKSIPPCDFHGEAVRLKAQGIYRMIQRHASAAGIPKDVAHPHALRHLFGTELAESDVDIKSIQNLMGHSNVETTLIYLQLAMRRLSENTDKGNPLGKMDTPLTPLLQQVNA